MLYNVGQHVMWPKGSGQSEFGLDRVTPCSINKSAKVTLRISKLLQWGKNDDGRGHGLSFGKLLRNNFSLEVSNFRREGRKLALGHWFSSRIVSLVKWREISCTSVLPELMSYLSGRFDWAVIDPEDNVTKFHKKLTVKQKRTRKKNYDKKEKTKVYLG